MFEKQSVLRSVCFPLIIRIFICHEGVSGDGSVPLFACVCMRVCVHALDELQTEGWAEWEQSWKKTIPSVLGQQKYFTACHEEAVMTSLKGSTFEWFTRMKIHNHLFCLQTYHLFSPAWIGGLIHSHADLHTAPALI